MRGVGIVVEAIDLVPACCLVETDGLGEGGVGVEAQGGNAEAAGLVFGGVHQAAGEAKTA